MARLARTLSDLSRYRRAFAAAAGVAGRTASPPSRLRETPEFGSNPGNLRMLSHVPATVAAQPALVVVLHGCTQTAAGYDHGTGWSGLADRHGFLLLFPEQQAANNPKTCFSWFEPEDIRRSGGEAQSIRSMVARMVADHGVAPARIFVTGLSAGGAMANVMLATYPEVFAGGAIIAGLPYGAAASVPEAFEAMFKGGSRPARAWGDLVRAASPHKGPWPKVSVWHGSADRTVVAANAAEIVKQWADVHGLAAGSDIRETGDGFSREGWGGVIESITLPGMAHGTPLATGSGNEQGGNAGPFLLDVGVSSTHHIARFFGLLDTQVEQAPSRDRVEAAAAPDRPVPLTPRPEDIRLPGERDRPARDDGEPRRAPGRTLPLDVEAVISKALRAAGLMRG